MAFGKRKILLKKRPAIIGAVVLAILIILGIALGVGLGVGLNKNSKLILSLF